MCPRITKKYLLNNSYPWHWQSLGFEFVYMCKKFFINIFIINHEIYRSICLIPIVELIDHSNSSPFSSFTSVKYQVNPHSVATRWNFGFRALRTVAGLRFVICKSAASGSKKLEVHKEIYYKQELLPSGRGGSGGGENNFGCLLRFTFKGLTTSSFSRLISGLTSIS